MASSKHDRNNENTPPTFVDQSTPVPKRPRLKALPVTLMEIKNIQQKQAQKDKEAAILKESADSRSRIQQVLSSITAAGYDTLYGFVEELLNTARFLLKKVNSWPITCAQPLIREQPICFAGECHGRGGTYCTDFVPSPPSGHDQFKTEPE